MNGAVARAGAELGVATPVNARLAALVDEVAADRSGGPGSAAIPSGCWRR